MYYHELERGIFYFNKETLKIYCVNDIYVFSVDSSGIFVEGDFKTKVENPCIVEILGVSRHLGESQWVNHDMVLFTDHCPEAFIKALKERGSRSCDIRHFDETKDIPWLTKSGIMRPKDEREVV